MNIKQEKERVNWLSAALATQRATISSFMDRLRGIAVQVGNSLPLHKKFMQLMDQVADDRDKELGIINEIETIEKRHRELKQLKLLRRADSAEEAKRKRRLKELGEEIRENEKDDEDSPHRLSIVEILTLYWLFSSKSGFFSSLNFFSKSQLLSGEPMPQPKADKLEPTVE
ncbi:MAG: hypothetical protein WC521_02135 [Bdellovibrionales bacterium]|jgi:hypothetical protein